ncbi:hypothetical protein [Pseudoalteromonas arctica]|uniref:IgGFc-binding protein N-terminal domain-containing protein n=1 Tax=Pseudoalteromonas arctica TaxID=394751 RepID=A0A7Y0DQQ2_9GAMM|nr:hypothetical protein [Pseudoalteromonas arctica]NMM39915.1 hypothetical protein [Pseudoalteromonas arctica]
MKPAFLLIHCFTAVLSFYSCLVIAQQDFQQAYAPINVSGITIFVPIELYPDTTTYLTIKETPTEYWLQWTKNSDSKYYIIEHYINGSWQLVASNITGNEYRADKSLGNKFRVKGCHQYGCAGWTSINNVNTSPLHITSFSTNKSKVAQGERVVVSWNVEGASEVNLKVNGTHYKALPFTGNKAITAYDYSSFELSAVGFGSTKKQKMAVVVDKPQVIKEVELSGYLQPLMNLGLDIVERAIVTSGNFTYVPTQDGFLHKVNNQSQIIWSKSLNGVMANKPIIDNGYLYYSVSLISGEGEICKTYMHSADTQCKSTGSEVIASPVIKPNKNSTSPPDEQAFSISNYFSGSLNSSLLSVSTTGLVNEYSLETLTVKNQFILPGDYRNNPILSDAKLSKQNELLLRTAPNQVTAFLIPSSGSGRGSEIFSSVQRFFTTSSDDTQNTEPQVLDIAWQKEL